MDRRNFILGVEIILFLFVSFFSAEYLNAQNTTIRINEIMVVNESSLVDK